ncbi:MAG TPA: CrcB family protein, partial [Ktedonobacteraceae bacterium]|nr:CrcB family protein [Ktedonobacteraceae bacterium]
VNSLADAALLVGPTRRLFLTTGFMGAYTTFSSLALGNVLLFRKGEIIPALLYLLLSLLGGLGMIVLGNRLGQYTITSLRGTHRSEVLSEESEVIKSQ